MDFFLDHMWLIWLLWTFLLGAGIGSWLNVCVARLPLEKSILWPGSRCGSCLSPIRWYDNIPLYGYLRLRGRCRDCGESYSIRYFLIELFTGVAYSAGFYLAVVDNWFGIALFAQESHAIRSFGVVPWQAWVFWLHLAVLTSLLIAASACDFDRLEIPLPLTITGTIIGLISATMFPWPWPDDPSLVPNVLPNADAPYPLTYAGEVPIGLYPWPAWGPLPEWAPPGSWQCGLLTGLAGAVVGVVLLRAVAGLFGRALGKEALGLGDADLMMMAGAFVGWQVVVIAFFVGAVASLFLAIPRALRTGENALPLGPGLSVGVIFTLFAWPRIGPEMQWLFFDWIILAMLIAFSFAFLLLAGLLLRFLRPT